MERAITASMIWSCVLVASLGAGAARLPVGDRAHTQPGILVVRDPGEAPAQLDHGGQFTILKISFADGRGGGFIDNEHCANVAARIGARQITIEREGPQRRAFRREAGGVGSSWEVRLVLKHRPTVPNKRRHRLETPREPCRTVRTSSAAASSQLYPRPPT